MNLSEMRTLLRRYGFEEGDPLTGWLNAALKEMETAADWPWLEEGPIFTTGKPGDNKLVLPVDAGKVIMIKDITNQYKLKYYDRHKFMRIIFDNTEEGLPEIYTIVDLHEIQFWRILNTEIKWEVIYQGVTPELVGNEDVPSTGAQVWPTATHYPIIMRAASIALQAENEEERAKVAQTQYDAALSRLIGKYCGERELDEPTTVEDAQGYGSDYPPTRWSQW